MKKWRCFLLVRESSLQTQYCYAKCLLEEAVALANFMAGSLHILSTLVLYTSWIFLTGPPSLENKKWISTNTALVTPWVQVQ